MFIFVSAEMELRKLIRRKEVSGGVPEFGAIFMSNRSTLKECFERKLLGLPSAMSGFVGRVKAGMTLFLFEFEERKLYGVFEAISDGGITLTLRHLFQQEGHSLHSLSVDSVVCIGQVKFTTIWHCDSLLEYEFCDAIRDNYFDTHKFNFGLSKEQIGSLLGLFSSRKLKIPTTLHRKRKNRKQDDKSRKGGGEKGRFAEIEISETKLGMDHANSDISEPEVEGHFLSSDPCRNFKSVDFGHDAYDPENPGFHHSVVSEALTAASHESLELVTLQSKKETFHFSAKDTEEYIPLSSPYHSADSEVEGFDFGKCSREEQIELDIFVDNKLSFIPVPQLPLAPILRDEGYNRTGAEHPFDSSLGSPCNRLDDPSYAHVSLSDAIDFPSKDGSNHFKPWPSKGMYSDKLKRRPSVFSRLNFPSKDINPKSQNDIRAKLVNNMSRVKQHSHVECQKIDKITPRKNEIEDPSVDDRTSEYIPLISALYAVPQQLHCMTGLEEGTGGLKKRNKDKFPRIEAL